MNGHDLLLVEHFEGGDLDVAGAISGNRNLDFRGGVELTGDQGNTFNGSVFLAYEFDLADAELTLNKQSGLAVPGPLVIGNDCTVKLERPHQIADSTTVVIHPRSGFLLQGNTETISGLYLAGNNSGANISIGGEQFTISYDGGDGNDLVLTRIPTPPRPALTIEGVAPLSVRLLWPASFADYTLQTTTNLNGANWVSALPLPVIFGANHVVTNATEDARNFYRLFKP